MYKFIGLGFALLSALSTAISIVLAKQSFGKTDPTIAATILSSIGTLVLIGVVIASKKSLIDFQTLHSINITAVFIAGIVGGLWWIFYFLAMRYVPLTHVSAIDQLSIVFTLFLCRYLFYEPITTATITGAFLIICGVYLISFF